MLSGVIRCSQEIIHRQLTVDFLMIDWISPIELAIHLFFGSPLP
jgi:hypothetical protein